MPRLGQVRAMSGRRISDFLAVWLLVWVFPPALVDRVIEECGRGGQRNRLLPPRTVVYFVLTMCLFPQSSYEEVGRLLAAAAVHVGLVPAAAPTPTTAALSRARARLGADPLRALFNEVTQRREVYWGEPADGRRRTVTLDAVVLAVPDSTENLERFGGPRLRRGGRALPQVLLVGLADSDTRRVRHAILGSSESQASALARASVEGLVPGDVLLAGGIVADPALVPLIRATGADVLWRIDAPVLPVRHPLPDGTYLSVVGGGTADHNVVRVLDVDSGVAASAGPSSHLVTSLLDHQAAPRGDLLARYLRRWTIEDALGALRPENPPDDQVLRSRWPDGIEQELWGHLLVQHAIRKLTPGGMDTRRA